MKKVKFIREDAGWFYIYKIEDKKFIVDAINGVAK